MRTPRWKRKGEDEDTNINLKKTVDERGKKKQGNCYFYWPCSPLMVISEGPVVVEQ